MPTIKTGTADGSPSPRFSIEPAQGIGFIGEYPLPHERVALEHVLKRLCMSTQIAMGLAERKVEIDLDLPRKSGEAFAQPDASFSNWVGLRQPSAECRLTGL